MQKIKNARSKILSLLMVVVIFVTMFAMTTIVSFASTGDNVAVTTEMLEPVLEGAKANIGVIVPVGIGLFVICLGVGYIPIIFNKFKRG